MSHSPGEKARLSSDRIRIFGDPVLKEESREIGERGPELDRLAKLMFEVMDREGGIGLAAPQIGIQRKIMVWRHPETEQGYVLLNPRIVERSEETVTASEGCLSLPGHSMEVERAERVVVEAVDLQGEPVTIEATGLLARIMQHEIDHLEGHIILDRTTSDERRRVLKDLRDSMEP
jgi:peptide deformylase